MQAATTLAFSALAACLVLPADAQTLVAARTLRAQSVIAPGDLAPGGTAIPGAIRDPEEAIGLETRVMIYAGHPVHASDLAPAASVERNQIVPLVFRRGGLTIVTEGRALGRGGTGDVIRVMNLSSRATLNARIDPDGSAAVSQH